jgi:hypothetical protein
LLPSQFPFDAADDGSVLETRVLPRLLIGCATRALICLAFIAGTIAYLHGLAARDLKLLLACVLGFGVFAATILIAGLVALLNTAGSPSATASEWVAIGLVLFFAPAYVWMAAVMFGVYRECAAKAAEGALAPAVDAAKLDDAAKLEALAAVAMSAGSDERERGVPPWRRAAAAITVALLITACVAGGLTLSWQEDPLHFLATFG